MNVQVTPAALREIDLLRQSGYRGMGFLLGAAIGHFILIEQLLPLDFDRKNGSTVYASVWRNCPQRLQGVFFCRKKRFTLDWFLQDLVMVIHPGRLELLTCEFSAAGRREVLAPLLEEEDGKWRT